MHEVRREQLKHVLELQETGGEPIDFLRKGGEEITYQYTRKLHNAPGLSDDEAERFRDRVLSHAAVELEAELPPEELENNKWAFTILVDEPDTEVQLDVIEIIFSEVLEHDFEDLDAIHGGIAGGQLELTLTGSPSEQANELESLELADLLEELTKSPSETPSFIDVSLQRDDEVLTVQTDLEPGEIAVGIGLELVDFEPDRFPAVVYRSDGNLPVFTAFDGTVLYPAADESGPDCLERFFERARAPNITVPESFEIDRAKVDDLLK